MTLLCIGDSNTYGYDPRSYFGDRYPADVRWTERLGTWKTVNCGMNGLAVPFNHTVFKDLIRSESPDVVAVMLGTNDLLEEANAETTAKRMEAFLTDIKDICPKLLLIVPPPMQPGEWVQSQKQIDESVINQVAMIKMLSAPYNMSILCLYISLVSPGSRTI